MESSEDDAGAATIASRRTSAREKNMEQIEDVSATSSSQQESSETKTTSENLAMSEDNFDGDSVPSPSTQDVNTSTEAILDMIDEIVDGPGAPKRLAVVYDNDAVCDTNESSTQSESVQNEVKDECASENASQSPNATPVISATSDNVISSVSTNLQAQSTSQNDDIPEVSTVCVDVAQTSSPKANCDETGAFTDAKEPIASCSDAPPRSPLPNIPSSSEPQSETILDSSNSVSSERTVKCVTSSDIRDNVTVESAESTSSDNSMSEGRVQGTETVTRSPLRRRLVRPAPSDRRPDSTVSSTVDSQSINVNTSELISECVVKDVSSSSDAVPLVHGNVKPEEIRNVSEVSICQAETSMCPPKKIKLIRQKIAPQINPSLATNVNDTLLSRESDQCQSTSSENISTDTCSESKSCISTSKTDIETVKSDLSVDSILAKSDSENVHHSQDLVAKTTETKCNRDNEPLQQISSETSVLPEDTSESMKILPPTKLNVPVVSVVTDSAVTETKVHTNDSSCSTIRETEPECMKQVPKLTIKLTNKVAEELKPPVPKLTIKPIRHSSPQNQEIVEVNKDQIPSVTKINIKPIPKRPEKITDFHRKSSSSEISESECSENDESTSTSDQASASDQGPPDVIPKVTIKLGKPGTETEGKFYTEQNIPKLTIKGIQSSENVEQSRGTDSPSKLKVVISQSDERQVEKVPKLTIKNVAKVESQPLSPKLTIKAIKPPDSAQKENISDEADSHLIPKLKISTESFASSTEVKDNMHVPKITIKPVTKSDNEPSPKTPKKSVTNDELANVPVVTKLIIKPIVKPTESGETSDNLDTKVPVVPKLNIKPIVKPKDSDVDSSKEDVPKKTKLTIKPIKSPEINSSEEKDCDDLKAAEHSIPVVTKLNIKPIVKPLDEDVNKDSENQSSETGNSSDDNTDQIPIVTKLNIKPICKPNDIDESKPSSSLDEDNIPVVTKLNIKPLLKPDGGRKSPSSPKKDSLKTEVKYGNVPIVTKLNIKPVLKPDDVKPKPSDEIEEATAKNPPLVMKINMKVKADSNKNENVYSIEKNDNTVHYNNVNENKLIVSKLNIKPIIKPPDPNMAKEILHNATADHYTNFSPSSSSIKTLDEDKKFISENIECSSIDLKPGENCVSDLINLNVTKDSVLNVTEQKNKAIITTGTGKNETLKDAAQTCTDVLNKDGLIKNPELINQNLKIAAIETDSTHLQSKQQSPSRQNCTLLKKLLEVRKDVENTLDDSKSKVINCSSPPQSRQDTVTPLLIDVSLKNELTSDRLNSEMKPDKSDKCTEKTNDSRGSPVHLKVRSMQELCKDVSENVTKPLEINVSDKVVTQNSDQDSPRIILKINKTDHGPSAKIITEDVKRLETSMDCPDNTQSYVNDVIYQNRGILNSRRKTHADANTTPMGKRLRSSRIVQSAEKAPIIRRNTGKRLSPSETTQSLTQNKEPELSVLETKRLKLGQLLSNKALTITPIIPKGPQLSPTKQSENKQVLKTTNHSLLNNENCSKNGNSKLHNILSNLQSKQIQTLSFNDMNCAEKDHSLTSELESSTSTGSSDVVSEILPSGKSQPEIHQMIFHDNSESRDFNMTADEVSQDPLEVDNSSKKITNSINDCIDIPKPVDLTPQPKKRGRPRKLPVSEGAKPVVTLPVPALEERPQRSLRLYRDRPVVLVKPRRGGRGRGRGARRLDAIPTSTSLTPTSETPDSTFIEQQKTEEEIDPTSSRIKLPRMTEALDKMPSMCSTPLTSRRRSSSNEMKFFGENAELKVVLENSLPMLDGSSMKSPDMMGEPRGRGRGGRGSRGGRGRTPVKTPRGGRGRGRGGGRGAMYMKETMGIYGRVCGPATTTVQLFEEETCMMDDNATPAKPSHLLDEDSQSSVKSSTNESNKMKKSKFADLFDRTKWVALYNQSITAPIPFKLKRNLQELHHTYLHSTNMCDDGTDADELGNKVWTAADVKEYTWPPPNKTDVEHQVMMIQEQVAMFLSVKSFKRRYPELKRRTIVGEERDYVLSKGLVIEALCDLGITAVDASEVLDIMLSDYPHKYEEYRSHQRQRKLAEPAEEPAKEIKQEEKSDKTEVKMESKAADSKPEAPKVDPEKTRQDMALAAMASASEWNARLNASRLRACADLQSLGVLRRRAPPAAPPAPRVRPPLGFYPHALLPGQYQHHYRTYTAQQLRYFPLNTAVEAPPAPPSPVWSSDSEPDGSSRASSSEHEDDSHRPAKRKKLTKTKRSSQAEAGSSSSNTGGPSGPSGSGGPGGSAAGPKDEPRAGEEVDTCRTCKLRLEANRKYTHERFLVCSNCNAKLHPSCVELGADTIRKCREYAWQCAECKSCCACARPADDDKMLFCDLCDRGFHIYCVGLPAVPGGRWHCVECAVCKSCGARDAAGDWHHQTRRGPGGHKLYSHSLCTPCARAYRIGRYCPLCERSFIGPKGTMQLVICKLCDRQLHQECVRPTVAHLDVLDYTCGECRRGGITSRAAAVRLAPRTIATLFMAKRRFNKYAHRQYLASRRRALEPEPEPEPEQEPEPPELQEIPERDASDASDSAESKRAERP